MFNKKGVDAVVATVLIIMITVAAVAIIWSTVIPMIKESASSATAEKVSLSIETSGGYTVWDPQTNYSFVQIRRDVDNTNLTGVRVSFFNGKETRSIIETDIPSVNTVKVYPFYFADFGKPVKVFISPIFADGTEGETVSELTSFDTGEITLEQSISKGLVKNVQTGKSILNEGLVGYWPFDLDVNDYSGNDNNGVSYGAISTTGKVGEAYEFDGANSYIEVLTNLGIPAGQKERTVSFWLYQRSREEGNNYALVEFSNQEGEQGYIIQMIDYYGEYYLFTDGINGDNNVMPEVYPDLNSWNFISFVFDGETTYSYYLNGNLVQSGEFGTQINTFVSGLNFGRRTLGAEGYLDGFLDEIGIWNRSLSSAEISQLYNSGSGLSLK
jgi:hypothetical protein